MKSSSPVLSKQQVALERAGNPGRLLASLLLNSITVPLLTRWHYEHDKLFIICSCHLVVIMQTNHMFRAFCISYYTDLSNIPIFDCFRNWLLFNLHLTCFNYVHPCQPNPVFPLVELRSEKQIYLSSSLLNSVSLLDEGKKQFTITDHHKAHK